MLGGFFLLKMKNITWGKNYPLLLKNKGTFKSIFIYLLLNNL